MKSHGIPGTVLFDGDQAQKGLALNRMCFSFNSAENRAAFVADEDAYCAKYGLSAEQRGCRRRRGKMRTILRQTEVSYRLRGE